MISVSQQHDLNISLYLTIKMGTAWGLNCQINKKVFRRTLKTLGISGTPDRIRTCDLRIRSPLLYPAELRAQTNESFSKFIQICPSKNDIINKLILLCKNLLLS
jgi:hypothetical protein